ncbi:MAG: hypothetical protein GHCLOJNM_03053 [bacterium]|nr:hypothetical protein [bacterium]
MHQRMMRCSACGRGTLADEGQSWALCDQCAVVRAKRALWAALGVFLGILALACFMGCANPATQKRLTSASAQIEQSADYLEAWIETSSKRQIDLYKYIQSGAKFGPDDIRDGIAGVQAEQGKTAKPLSGLRRAKDQVEIAAEEVNQSWTR